MTCEHVTSVLIPYCEIPVSINSIDVMEITRLAESSIIQSVNADQLLQLFAPLPSWIRFVFPGIWCYL